MFGKWFFDPRKQSANGGCLVSNSIMNKEGQLKWCVRHKPLNRQDTGWEFYSDIDTPDIEDDPSKFSIQSFRAVCEIEPLIMEIFNMPVGTDICLIKDEGDAWFVDSTTYETIDTTK